MIDKEELLSICQRMIQIPSNREVEGQEKAVAIYLYNLLRDEGIETELVEVTENRANILGYIRGDGSGPTLMMNGHLDTVEVGAHLNAYSGEVRNGKIYGRGAADMKCAIAAMAYAQIILARAQANLKGNLILAGVIDEETCSRGSLHLLEKGPVPDMVIVGEATSLNVGIAHKGIVWLRVCFEGKAAHSSHPEAGINAIYKARRFIQALEEEVIPALQKRIHPLLGSPSLNVGVVRGGQRAPTVPAYCVVEFDRRWIPGETKESVIQEVKDILERLASEVSDFKYHLGEMEQSAKFIHHTLNTEPDALIVKKVQQARLLAGFPEASVVGVPFWSDGALFSSQAKIPTVICGPGCEKQAHSDNEWVSVDEVYQAVKIYLASAINICG